PVSSSHSLFSFSFSVDRPSLPSFPTRRSSDLGQAPLGDHVARHLGRALDVVGGAGGDLVLAEDQLLGDAAAVQRAKLRLDRGAVDRKSTRLNSSHVKISYAVFCLKKKKRNTST